MKFFAILKKCNYLWLIFLFFCFGLFILASYFSLHDLLTNLNFRSNTLNLLVIILLIFIIFNLVINRVKLRNANRFIIISIIILGIFLRFFSMIYFKTVQTSDFAKGIQLYEAFDTTYFSYHEHHIGEHKLQSYFAKFPAWFTHSMITVGIFKIFGFNEEFLKLYNLLLYIFSV